MGGPMAAPVLCCPFCAADDSAPVWQPMTFVFTPCPGIPAEDRDRYFGCITLPRWRFVCSECLYSEIHVAKWWGAPMARPERETP